MLSYPIPSRSRYTLRMPPMRPSNFRLVPWLVAGLVLWTGRVPAMLVVLAAGAVGWLAAL